MKSIILFLCTCCISSSVFSQDTLQCPCSDSVYVELCKIPLKSMTAGEAVYFVAMKKSCDEYLESIVRNKRIDSTLAYVDTRVRSGIREGGRATLFTVFLVGIITLFILTVPK
jgi:hypothetical protein